MDRASRHAHPLRVHVQASNERLQCWAYMHIYIYISKCHADARMWRWQDFPPAHSEWSSCAVPRILQFLAKSAISFPAIGSSGQPSEACCGEMNIGREAAGTRHFGGTERMGHENTIDAAYHDPISYHMGNGDDGGN